MVAINVMGRNTAATIAKMATDAKSCIIISNSYYVTTLRVIALAFWMRLSRLERRSWVMSREGTQRQGSCPQYVNSK